MEVVFEDNKLESLYSVEFHKLGLPRSVVYSARRKLKYLRTIIDERDIFKMNGLRFEKLKGKLKNHYSIRLNNQYRLVFKFDRSISPNRIIVVSILDYH